MLRLTIPGDPRGQARPRFARVGKGVRAYPDAKDTSYAQRVHAEWIAAGRPCLPDGPVELRVWAFFERPKGHYTSRGTLSAEGKRSIVPTRKPDLTNIEKMLEDALVSVGALPDDAKIVRKHSSKNWAGGAMDKPCVVVWAESLGAPA